MGSFIRSLAYQKAPLSQLSKHRIYYTSAGTRPDETITFSEEDAVPPITPPTDALVILAIVANKEVHRVHIDQGSAVDVLYVNCIKQLGIGFDNL